MRAMLVALLFLAPDTSEQDAADQVAAHKLADLEWRFSFYPPVECLEYQLAIAEAHCAWVREQCLLHAETADAGPWEEWRQEAEALRCGLATLLYAKRLPRYPELDAQALERYWDVCERFGVPRLSVLPAVPLWRMQRVTRYGK